MFPILIPGMGVDPPSLSPSNRDPSSIPQPTSGNFGTQRRADGLAMEFTSSGTTANRLTISMPPTATVSMMFEKEVICFNSTLLQLCHSSRIINEALLKMVKCIPISIMSKLSIVEPLMSLDPHSEDGDYS